MKMTADFVDGWPTRLVNRPQSFLQASCTAANSNVARKLQQVRWGECWKSAHGFDEWTAMSSSPFCTRDGKERRQQLEERTNGSQWSWAGHDHHLAASHLRPLLGEPASARLEHCHHRSPEMVKEVRVWCSGYWRPAVVIFSTIFDDNSMYEQTDVRICKDFS